MDTVGPSAASSVTLSSTGISFTDTTVFTV